MIKAIDTSLAGWEVDSREDPRFATCAEKLVAAAAVFAGQRDILVVHIDSWFGERWLGFGKLGPYGIHANIRAREPDYRVPPFHPNRVLSEKRYEMSEDGVLRGPFEPSRQLHHHYRPNEYRARTFKQTCEPGVYAWYSGNTKANDRASLMAYTQSAEGTSAWYVELRNADGWRLSQRIGIGDAEWRQLLAIGGVTELEAS